MSSRLTAVAVASTILGTTWTWNRPAGDLPAFVNAGNAVLAGGSPYLSAHPNANPPVSLPLCAGLAALGDAAAVGLIAASLLAGALTCAVLGRRASVPLLALAPFWLTLAWGQVYMLLLPLAAIAYARTGLARALALGLLVAVKPQLGPALPALFLAGERRTAVGAALVAAGAWALPAAVWGIDIYVDWLAAAQGIANANANPSFLAGLSGVWHTFNLPWFEGVAASVLALGLLGCWRLQLSARDAIGVGIALGLLCAPVVWTAYGLFLLPWLVRRPALVVALSLPVWALASYGPGYVYTAVWLAFIGAIALPAFHVARATVAEPLAER